MKKILITGKSSYIGTSFEKFILDNYSSEYQIDSISVKGEDWKSYSFTEYDVVLHVAGIAHVKETKHNRKLYYEVNRDLAFEVAKKAKLENVNQFIFLSSMSVYGIEKGIITRETKEKPKSSYGKSKLDAELLIKNLEEDGFNVCIIRPPMVYGKGCKGNFPKLVKVCRKLFLFPNIRNKRSMICIDNLCWFLIFVISNNKRGYFFPQNNEYVNTCDMVTQILQLSDISVHTTSIFNFPIIILSLIFPKFQKIFGTLVYDFEMSFFELDYNYLTFKDSIRESI